MPRPGALSTRVTFQRRAVATDGYGNTQGAWAALFDRWASLQIEDAREAVKSGRLEAATGGVLRVRVDPDTATLTAADRVVIDGQAWNIRQDPQNRDRRARYLEMKVEAGVAT